MKPISIATLVVLALASGCDISSTELATPDGSAQLSELRGKRREPMDSAGRVISARDPFVRHSIRVGSDPREVLAYVDEGHGDPIILLHGAPSSSYLWRNVIPHLTPSARVLAIDWMGSGDSGVSPSGDYSYLNQLRYLESFIAGLGLRNVTIVTHDWSSIVALTYAHQHQENVKGVASLEAVYFPIPDVSVMPPLAQRFIGPEGEQLIVEENAFMEIMIPGFTVRSLSDKELRNYGRRWKAKKNRYALLAVPKELPIAGQPLELWNQFGAASYWFASESPNLPKFFAYASEGPGVLVTAAVADPETGASMIDIVSSFPNTTVAALPGAGLHFLQEDHPHDLGISLARWYSSLY